VLQWSVPIAANGCALLVAATDERVACMTTGGVVVFNATGTLIWSAAALPVSNAMAFDASGNLWIAGGVYCSHGLCAALVKLDASGATVASDSVVDPARIGQWNALSIGPTGDVYVTGLSRPLPTMTFPPSDMMTARYDNAAVRQWTTTYVGAGNWNDVGTVVFAASDGAIVGGRVHDTIAPSLAVIKYGATALAVAAPSEVPLIAAPLVLILSMLVGIAGANAVGTRRRSCPR
jgi:hypothetical protein